MFGTLTRLGPEGSVAGVGSEHRTGSFLRPVKAGAAVRTDREGAAPEGRKGGRVRVSGWVRDPNWTRGKEVWKRRGGTDSHRSGRNVTGKFLLRFRPTLTETNGN